MKVYEISISNIFKIQEVQCEKYTDLTLTVNGRRCFWRSNYRNYFKSKEEAKKWVVERFESNVTRLSAMLDTEKDKLQRAQSMEV